MGLTRKEIFTSKIDASSPDEIVYAAQQALSRRSKVADQCRWASEYLEQIDLEKVKGDPKYIQPAQKVLEGLSILHDGGYKSQDKDIDVSNLCDDIRHCNPLEIFVGVQNVLDCCVGDVSRDEILPTFIDSTQQALNYLHGLNGNSSYPIEHIDATKQALEGIKELYE